VEGRGAEAGYPGGGSGSRGTGRLSGKGTVKSDVP
jgi:hypothetical protein